MVDARYSRIKRLFYSLVLGDRAPAPTYVEHQVAAGDLELQAWRLASAGFSPKTVVQVPN